ncbi:hypothetical protein [Marvinbryantia formatexigens]|uniref:hypothetical protein n=1 Tax=Marvinbryantia formatexigens TaxID=168384 RepID=UPI00031FA65A|nr:hypothetical protein [Marvinbryantia formatexigens]UWO23363.1 hypothetical protein NQ534_12985 [Marvinbryantia formatexigens DSM 14469]SDG39914.1 hypothetical protein SAMN05660368_02483 [Marvinbryantia formatexigens]
MKGLKDKLYQFMQGRNGIDEMGSVLIWTSLILLIISTLLNSFILSLIAFALLIYSYFRVFSRNLGARQAENQRYLAQRERLRFKLQSLKVRLGLHKTHKYLKCKKCSKKMRVPRGKGKIEVTCPHCGEKFITRS